MSCVKYIISGRVQGVGFRAFVVRQAHQLGIIGWVKNEDDGTVVCLIKLSRSEVLEQFKAFLYKGPRWSKVTHIDVIPCTNTLTSQTFEIKY